MAELADALALGASVLIGRAGSSPALGTMKNKFKLTPERLLYFLVLFLFILVTIFRLKLGEEEGLLDFLPYYTGLLFGPFLRSVTNYIGLMVLLAFMVFGLAWIYAGLRGQNPYEKLKSFFGASARKWWKERVVVFLKAGLSTVAVFVLTGLIMSYLNVVNQPFLRDNEVALWDKSLFGDYPFVAIYEYLYPEWLVWLIAQGFSYLPFGFFLLFFITLYLRIDLFSKMAVTFALGLVISLPLWHIFPVLSPHDRYIDNVYELPIPGEIEKRLENFSPQADIQKYLDSARDKKNKRLQFHYPTSTLPSAHVEWAVFFIYFSALIDRRLLLITVPIGIFSSIGTFFLLQHYVVDVPAGILVAIAAIWIVNKLFPETPKTL